MMKLFCLIHKNDFDASEINTNPLRKALYDFKQFYNQKGSVVSLGPHINYSDLYSLFFVYKENGEAVSGFSDMIFFRQGLGYFQRCQSARAIEEYAFGCKNVAENDRFCFASRTFTFYLQNT